MDSEEFNRKFNVKTNKFTVNLNFQENDFVLANKAVEEFFEKVHSKLSETMTEHQKISIFIDHISLDMPITIPFIDKQTFTKELLSNSFIKVCQSKRAFRIGRNVELKN